MKNILWAALIIAILAILIAGGYYLRSRQEAPATPPEQSGTGLPIPNNPAAQTPGSQNSQNATGTQNQQTNQTGTPNFKLVSESQALDNFYDQSGNVLIDHPD
jgi:hypothetical protein